MSKMISLSAVAVAVILLAMPVRASEKADIVDTAVAAGSFNTLVAAVKAADLVTTLKSPGPFTVFAPTDAAFARTLVAKMKTGPGTLPHYYQVVLKVRSMDEMPIDIAYVFHRDLEPLKGSVPEGQ